jgi:hypothetical protein
MKISSRIYPLAIRVLTRRITRLNTSNKDAAVRRLGRQALLRVRALLLVRFHSEERPRWSATRQLVLLLDPVAAGLWPRLRSRRGLNLPQRLARAFAARANPLALEAVSSADVREVGQLLRALQQKLDRQTPSIPRTRDSGSLRECEARLKLPYSIGGNTNRTVLGPIGYGDSK